MRLLLIEDDATQCEFIQQRVMSRYPDSVIVVRRPDLQGALAPEFLAQGFDVVLFGHGRGLEELRDLTCRAGFAPVVFIALRSDHVDSSEAKESGAHSVVGRDELGTERFFSMLQDAE